jgi:uncharacterized membrane protein
LERYRGLGRTHPGGRETGRQASGAILPPDIAEAQAVLQRRYAAGEITREDYLQAKVELEMT